MFEIQFLASTRRLDTGYYGDVDEVFGGGRCFLVIFAVSADVTHRFSLSAILTSGDRTIRLDSIAFPSGFAFNLTQDVSD